MQKRKMGPDGPEVSAIGIGAMSFAGVYGETDEPEAHRLLDAALDMGIDQIDTANVYGMGVSETMIGNWIAKRGANPYFIATKASISKDAEGNRCFDNSAAHLEAELDQSLKRLNVDCVDLFYAHRRDPRIEIEEATENLARLVKAGKAKSIGFSEIAPSSLRRAAAVHPVAAVQSEYSLATRYPELGLIQECARQGAAMVAFSPVCRGLLADYRMDRSDVEKSWFLQSAPRFQAPNFEANLAATDGFRALAADMGVPTAGLAMAWLLAKGEAVVPIPGTRTVDHLSELAAGGSLTLDAEAMARIEEVLPAGWAHGDRYSVQQWVGPERYC